MMTATPAKMLGVTAPSYTDPKDYQLSQVAKPILQSPKDVVFKVHAASINPVDVKLVSGVFKAALSQTSASAYLRGREVAS